VPARRPARQVHAAAVVGHPQQDRFAIGLNVDVDFGGPGMAANVGEGFLHDAEAGCGGFIGQIELINLADELAGGAGALEKVLEVELKRGQQAEVIEQLGPQLGGQAAHRVDAVGDQGSHRNKLFARRLGQALRFAEAAGVHLERGEGAAELVVELARHAGALLLARTLGLALRLAPLADLGHQLFVGFRQALVGGLQFGGSILHARLEFAVQAGALERQGTLLAHGEHKFAVVGLEWPRSSKANLQHANQAVGQHQRHGHQCAMLAFGCG
jgi:hypothetical protein